MSDVTTNQGGLGLDAKDSGTVNFAGTGAGRDVINNNSEAVAIAQQLIETGSEKDTLYGSALLSIIERTEQQVASYRAELAQVYQERRQLESILAADTSELELMRERLDRHKAKQIELEIKVESCRSDKRILYGLVAGFALVIVILLSYFVFSGDLIGAGAVSAVALVSSWIAANP